MTLEEAFEKAALAKVAAQKAAREADDAMADLVQMMQEQGETKVVLNEDVHGTLVAPTRVTYDALQLEATLTPRQWERVTKRVIDNELLEAAVAVKAIPMAKVEKAASIKPTKAYVRMTGITTLV